MCRHQKVSGRPAPALAKTASAPAGHSRRASGELGGDVRGSARNLAPDDAQENDGELEEYGEGDAEDHRTVGIGAWRDDAGEYPEPKEYVQPLLAQELAANDAEHTHEGNDERQLKRESKSQQEIGDEGEVAIGR